MVALYSSDKLWEERDNLDDLEDLELLTREELIELLRERAEAGVNLAFPGKAATRRLARLVRPRAQKMVAKYSVGPEEERANNLLIEGDNLQALVTLYRDRGQVDLILTDPPYNTGNDFRYNDRWEEDPNDPDMGDFVKSDDPARHTKWMRFMYPRLQMMKAMLKPGGVFAICIDHRELFRLGQSLDEIFGERNRIAIINWQKTSAPKSANAHVSSSTEYVLVYANDADRVYTERGDRMESSNSRYGNPDSDPQGDWREGNLTAPEHRKLTSYGIQSPFSGEVFYPAGNGHWRRAKDDVKRWLEEWGTPYVETDIGDGEAKALLVAGGGPGKVPAAAKKRAQALLKAGPWPFIWFGHDGTGRPRVKTYLSQLKRGTIPVTFWAEEDLLPLKLDSTSWPFAESGRSSDGIAELTAVVGAGHGFETVKPLRLMQKIIQLWCPPVGVVLDPFAGSGTTGQAVLMLNQTQSASRRFILIEQGRPEKGDSYARSLTANRLARSITGNWKTGPKPPVGGGFAFRQLTNQVDALALLQMERDEMVDTVIASYFDASRRRGPSLQRFTDQGYSYLVAHNSEGEGFYLVWDGPDHNIDLTEVVYDSCVAEAQRAGLKPIYHVYARLNLFSTDGVRFYQIPDRILADFGLDVRTESYESKDLNG